VDHTIRTLADQRLVQARAIAEVSRTRERPRRLGARPPDECDDFMTSMHEHLAQHSTDEAAGACYEHAHD
jgi:hypothetical protein